MEVELERQTVWPGEELRGSVRVDPGAKVLTVGLQGEEVLGASSLLRSYVYPVVDEVAEFENPEGELPFAFRLPDDAPPSYASPDLRCQYFLKARLRTGRLGGDTIKRLHVTVLPPAEEAPESTARDLMLEDGGVRLQAVLDSTTLAAGESLRGQLLLSRESEDTQLPSRLTFRLAAIEESLDRSYRHRQVLWVQSHDVEPGPDMDFPVEGTFQFPIAEDAPFSGDWRSFRLHYGFRVGMVLPGGRQVRESVPIRVFRRYGG